MPLPVGQAKNFLRESDPETTIELEVTLGAKMSQMTRGSL